MMTALRERYARNRMLWTGLATGALVAVLLIGSTVLTNAQLGKRAIDVEFVQAAGLAPGDAVSVAGVEAGRVESVRIAGDHVVARLQVDRDLQFGPDARASIEMSTILGKIHVALIPGDHTGLPDNRIPLANTSVPYNLAKVVNDPRYTSQFEHLERIDAPKLRETLDLLRDQMGESPQLTIDAIDSVGVLAKLLADRRDDVSTLLHNLDQVSQLVSDNQNNVLLLLTRGEAIGQAVSQRQDMFRQLLDSVADLSRQLQDMGIENDGQLGPLIRNLDTMSDGLTKNAGNLDALFQIMPVALRQFNNTMGNGPYADVYAPWLFPDNWLCFAQVVAGCN